MRNWIKVWLARLNSYNGILTALGTIAVAVLTYFIATDSHRQGATADRELDAMQTQSRVMQQQLDQMKAVQRAWVSISSNISISEPLTYGINGPVIVLDVKLISTGSIPAQDVSVAATAVLDSILSDKDKAEACALAGLLAQNNGTSLFPGTTMDVSDVKANIYPNDKMIKITGEVPPLIMVCISYHSAGDVIPRTTVYDLWLQMKAPFLPGQGCCGIIVKNGTIPASDLRLLHWPFSDIAN